MLSIDVIHKNKSSLGPSITPNGVSGSWDPCVSTAGETPKRGAAFLRYCAPSCRSSRRRGWGTWPVFSGNALSRKKRHCLWNQDFNGLRSQEKQSKQACVPPLLPPAPHAMPPPPCVLYLTLGGWLMGVRGLWARPRWGLPSSLDSPTVPFPIPPRWLFSLPMKVTV